MALVGSDWGGGVALSMASSRRHKHLVGEVVALMPSYAEKEKVGAQCRRHLWV
jgi:hypothetical protein